MDIANTVGGSSGILTRVVFFIVVLVALYFLYNWLYSTSTIESKNLNPGIFNANRTTELLVTSDQLPTLYEGGEYSVSAWIYVNDYSVRRGYNKHILSIGGSSFSTLAIYLGPTNTTLSVRVQTQSPGLVATSSTPTTPSSASDSLTTESINTLFTTLQMEDGLVNVLKPCDLQNIEMQKWLCVTVVLNNTTCDVYLDGKLARSCVLPSFFKVDKTGLSGKVCSFQGFGGYVGPINAYNYALNPEQAWRIYMAGPGPQYGLLDYLKSLFDPKAIGSLSYPKMNV